MTWIIENADVLRDGFALLGSIALSVRGFLQFLAPLTKKWDGDDKALAFLDRFLGWASLGGAPKRDAK